MRKEHKVALGFSVLTLLSLCGFIWFYLSYHNSIYPNYIAFQPKYRFRNKFYRLVATSYITELYIGEQDICAYYRIFNCEENYLGNWELEYLNWRKNFENQLYTESKLLTQRIWKNWTFLPEKPYFFLTIQRTYLFNSTNLNNQIIIHLKNMGIYTNINTTEPISKVDGQPWLAFKTRYGVFGFIVLSSNCYDDLYIQIPNSPPCTCIHGERDTEVQINFHGQRDLDTRFHREGETETITLLCYAKENGTWKDLLKLFS